MLASEDLGQLCLTGVGLGPVNKGNLGCIVKTRRTHPMPGTSPLCFLLRY